MIDSFFTNKRDSAAQNTVRLCLCVGCLHGCGMGSCLRSQWGLQVLEAPRAEHSCCLTRPGSLPAPSLTSVLMQNWRGCSLVVVCSLALCVCVGGFGWVFFFFKLEAFEGNGGKNWKLKNWKHSAPHVLLVLLLRESGVTLKERSLELPMKMAACRKRRAWPCVYFPKWLLMPEANCMQPKPRARHVWPQ